MLTLRLALLLRASAVIETCKLINDVYDIHPYSPLSRGEAEDFAEKKMIIDTN